MSEKETSQMKDATKTSEARGPVENKATSPEIGNEKTPDAPAKDDGTKGSGRGRRKNNLQKFRLERMMSKAELARRANLSVLTIDRIEKGYGCRMDTKRKILEALGLKLVDRNKIFGEDS